MDRKRSCEKLRNGMDLSSIFDEWGHLQRNLRGNKGNFLSCQLLQEKGRRKPDHRLIYTTSKQKNGINLKRIWY